MSTGLGGASAGARAGPAGMSADLPAARRVADSYSPSIMHLQTTAGNAAVTSDGPRVFRTAAWWLLCCLLPVQVLVVDLEWGLVAES